MGNKFERMMRILSILSEYKWKTSGELADTLGVSDRSIKRYIQDINIPFEDIGIGLIESSKNGYRLRDTNFLDRLKGIDDQYTIAAINTSPFGESLNSKPVLNREILAKLLPRLQRPEIIDNPITKALLQALVQNRILSISYTKANGENKNYKIIPLKIVSNDGTQYLQCYCLDKGYEKMLTFVISKIDDIKTRDVFSDRKLIVEKLAFIDSRWGTFISDKEDYTGEVRFIVDESLHEKMQRNLLHSSQEYVMDEGEPVYTLKVHNIQEFARWTMKYSWHLDVIEPQSVIDILKREARDILEKYED
ncbi:MAG: WYL domain-containing protein [Candidatus Delongbacteria bacterium]|nr:WYL domain-containing protein [Candidatus Delongbacteria bacterium]